MPKRQPFRIGKGLEESTEAVYLGESNIITTFMKGLFKALAFLLLALAMPALAHSQNGSYGGYQPANGAVLSPCNPEGYAANPWPAKLVEDVLSKTTQHYGLSLADLMSDFGDCGVVITYVGGGKFSVHHSSAASCCIEVALEL